MRKVSVIVPLFNRADIISHTIDSVINQTHENWELLIVDDESSDNSVQVVTAYSVNDDRINLIQRVTQTRGGNACRNIGLKQATGDYVIFLDSDDLLKPHCFETRIKSIESAQGLNFAVFPGATFQDDRGTPRHFWNIETGLEDYIRFLQLDSPWQTTGVIWTRDFLFERNLSWDERLAIWQDVDFHLNILLLNPVYKVFWEMDIDYLIRENSADSVSRVGYFKADKVNSRVSFFQKYLTVLSEKKKGTRQLRKVFFIVLKSLSVHRNWPLVKEIIAKSLTYGVITKYESVRLLCAVLMAKITRNRILVFPGKKIELWIDNQPADTLQKVPYVERNSQ
ncbi:glycosyltransferase family 2 protein [Flavihumibacter fluvii]|uniref:glycosyltransferase family 2 protein n=1 Tax=Flavihumibacter fluvii TaxID=2838157 RepID=UPI001BDDECFE|nr:glycosyltransferase family 2 protein [Flavihumibacter fluvii]ULQ52395.1 glycosyltransferase [Flavihumibacter fluvii]